MQNNLGRVYTADNTLAANRIVWHARRDGQLTFDASPAQTLTEFNNWDAATKRVIRLEFVGPNAEIEAAINEVQTLTGGGTWSAGTYVLTILGQPTSAIAFGANAATIQTALNTALSTAYGSTYSVGVTGGPLGTTPVVVTFSGTGVAGRNVPMISADISLVTGSCADRLRCRDHARLQRRAPCWWTSRAPGRPSTSAATPTASGPTR
jgi:hypothetical protein